MTRRLAAHLMLLLVGLVALTWPLTFGAHPRIECRGSEMHPGDVCHKLELDGTDHGRTQTYEERRATAMSANPVVAGVGVVVIVFAGALAVGEVRRVRRPGPETGVTEPGRPS